jgi:ESCRT-I complex subunit TSG101
MLTALQTLQSELHALDSLKDTLDSNTAILHTSLQKADAVIQDSQHRQPPGVDEILVAPNVVGNQLYSLVSEERALGDAIFILGRAVEKGRISGPVFVKQTRGLARDWFLKKALVAKIGKGMGLDNRY